MMLRLALHCLSVFLAIRGTISQETCCAKKTINNVEYILTQDQIASNPSCVDGCIYQEVDNPFSYACFVDAFNEVGCSVNVEQPNSSIQPTTSTVFDTTSQPTTTTKQPTTSSTTQHPSTTSTTQQPTTTSTTTQQP